MARPKAVPKIELEDQVEKLASIHCSWAEIAAVTGMNEHTLRKRFGHAFKKGLSKGKVSLKRKMFEMAMGGHATLLIWLSKQHLGYTDKVEQQQNIDLKSDIVYQTEYGTLPGPKQ